MFKLARFVNLAMMEVFKADVRGHDVQTAKVRGRENLAVRIPTRAELNGYFLGAGCAGGYDPTTHWCGIYATHFLRLADVRCHWERGNGIIDDSGGEDLEIVYGPDAQKGLKFGDVLVREPEHHHIIVFGEVEAGPIRCIEGNAGGIKHPLIAMDYPPNQANNSVGRVVSRYRIRQTLSFAGIRPRN